MMRNINDLSVILSIVGSFSGGMPKKELSSSIQNKFPYIQWDIQPKELFDMSVRLNLLVPFNNYIRLTEFGQDVQAMATEGVDLNNKQILYIANNCVLTNKNFSQLINFLRSFVFDKQRKTLVYNMADYPITDTTDIELLTQLGIIYKRKTTWFLNRTYLDLIDEILHARTQDRSRTKTFTQEQLERVLAEQKKIGGLAEDLSMQYERNRLHSKSLHEESLKIRHVSITNANIGYDIESFRRKTPSMKHDLFIEVKARKHKMNSFIITNNELQTAKRLGAKYAIYFWNGLGYHIPSNPTKIIHDPINTLKILECDNCLTYIVYLDDFVQRT